MANYKIQTGLRISEATHNKLKVLATKDHRSINNLIEFIIQNYLEEYEAKNGVIPVLPEE